MAERRLLRHSHSSQARQAAGGTRKYFSASSPHEREAHKRAQDGLKENEELTFSDGELDLILSAALRSNLEDGDGVDFNH
jgi:hypothetical protein